jgi:hypothetical protein
MILTRTKMLQLTCSKWCGSEVGVRASFLGFQKRTTADGYDACGVSLFLSVLPSSTTNTCPSYVAAITLCRRYALQKVRMLPYPSTSTPYSYTMKSPPVFSGVRFGWERTTMLRCRLLPSLADTVAAVLSSYFLPEAALKADSSLSDPIEC